MKRPGWLSLTVVAVAVLASLLLYDRGVSTTPKNPEPVIESSVPAATVIPTEPPEQEPHLDPEYMRIVQEGLPTPGCDDAREPPLGIFNEEQARAEYQRALENLSAANDPALILASALLSGLSVVTGVAEDKDERIRRLHRAFDINPESKLTMWHLLQECFGHDCGGQKLLDEAVRVDGDNAAIWIERARAAIREEDWASAESELRKGIAAPRYTIYFYEQAILLERALAASSNFSNAERSFAAFGIAAAVAVPQYGDITNACRNDSNDAHTWASLCDQIGELMIEEGGTMIDHAIGLALRRIAAERVGNHTAVTRFNEERNVLKRAQNEMILSGAAVLGENDFAFHSRYLEYFAAYGEVEASRLSSADARRLRADPTYDQCNFVRRKWPDS